MTKGKWDETGNLVCIGLACTVIVLARLGDVAFALIGLWAGGKIIRGAYLEHHQQEK